MNILVLNSGSSSLKYQLNNPSQSRPVVRGVIERIGEPETPDHRTALERVLASLSEEQVHAVGHRVVHGGEHFRKSTLLNEETLRILEDLTPLAPLHNPAALAGIHASMELLPGVPNVGVFDTAFHATLPRHAFLYALPRELYEQHGIRRYGFHGTSHAFVSRAAAQFLGRSLGDLRLVTLHLGNGASACAIRGGASVDTSMGFTPLEGLVMGTRSGDVDPAIALWLAERYGASESGNILNRQSGLLGLSGVSNDLRDLHAARQQGNERAADALAVMTYRLRKQIGAYAATLGGIDALVFTGGVGENDAWTRAEVLQGLSFLGFDLDPEANDRHATLITRGATPALVIHTDEESEIARETREVLAH